ncbi:hypothetical protein L1987_64445 [Smallanthus sonchifolius]|uniref:Uncharacterized protein n=1 Tax=Smallanthus sonchifolius TaxID=185202 RepID=A0ACB9CG33_9ASTR|nr:hypothetical protein L1987_64445 [Smallanthus sonchifolius]
MLLISLFRVFDRQICGTVEMLGTKKLGYMGVSIFDCLWYRLYGEWKKDDECNPIVLSAKQTAKKDLETSCKGMSIYMLIEKTISPAYELVRQPQLQPIEGASASALWWVLIGLLTEFVAFNIH